MRNFTTPWMNEKLQKLTTYIRGSQVFHTLEKNRGTGVTPSQHSNPCEVLLTQTVVLLPRPESALFLVFPAGFLSKIYTTSQSFLPPTAPARHGWLIPFPPDHSPGLWQLSWIQQLSTLGENSGKGGKAPPLLEVTLRTTARRL